MILGGGGASLVIFQLEGNFDAKMIPMGGNPKIWIRTFNFHLCSLFKMNMVLVWLNERPENSPNSHIVVWSSGIVFIGLERNKVQLSANSLKLDLWTERLLMEGHFQIVVVRGSILFIYLFNLYPTLPATSLSLWKVKVTGQLWLVPLVKLKSSEYVLFAKSCALGTCKTINYTSMFITKTPSPPALEKLIPLRQTLFRHLAPGCRCCWDCEFYSLE